MSTGKHSWNDDDIQLKVKWMPTCFLERRKYTTVLAPPTGFLFVYTTLTCENLLPEVGKKLEIDGALHDALEGSELRVEAQREEHQEEQHGPQVACRELIDCLCEQNESQTRSRRRLKS